MKRRRYFIFANFWRSFCKWIVNKLNKIRQTDNRFCYKFKFAFVVQYLFKQLTQLGQFDVWSKYTHFSPEFDHLHPTYYVDVIRHIYSNLYTDIQYGKSIWNRSGIKEKFASWLISTCARNRSLWKLRCSVQHILLVSSFELAGKSINSGYYTTKRSARQQHAYNYASVILGVRWRLYTISVPFPFFHHFNIHIVEQLDF